MDKHHRKHAKLPLPGGGSWGRTELALLGAPCSVIEELAQRLIVQFSGQWKIGFADAAHGSNDAGQQARAAVSLRSEAGHVQIDMRRAPAGLERRTLFAACDLVLVNGNHFTAQSQVLLVHPGKSLEHRLEQLCDVRLVILCELATIPEYLLSHVEGVPIMAWEDTEQFVAFFQSYLKMQRPALNGLVLSGGQSLRMGSDKSLLSYHGRPQRDHVYELLQPFCGEVFISCNSKQAAGIAQPIIEDCFLGIGPMGGLLSALQLAPDRAWLVAACDMPYLGPESLRHLLACRDSSKLATVYRNPEHGFPEPLLGIWEPRAYPALLQALASGISCPRKILAASDIALIDAPDPDQLLNVNDPATYQEALFRLTSNSST